MNSLRLAMLAALLFDPAATRAAENKYDVLGQTLAPFVQLLGSKSKTANRAVTLSIRLESMTDLPDEWADARAEVALEAPDKLRLHGPVLGEELTICRNGQELWVFPGSKAQALIELATAEKRLPPPDKKFRLEPFKLPIPEKQLIFLPALFQIQDAGTERIDGETCRVLELALMAEISRSIGSDWTARIWVRADHRPVRLKVTRPGWEVTLRFEAVSFAPTLPASTWQPSPEEAEDVLKITPARYQQLLKLIGGGSAKK